MKKKIRSVLQYAMIMMVILALVWMMCMPIWVANAEDEEDTLVEVEATTPEGSGTKSDPYLITTVSELVYCQEYYSDTSREDEYVYWKLCNNLDMDNVDFEPIGIYASSPDESLSKRGFFGEFDGNNHIIYNLYMSTTDSDYDYMGLFACMLDTNSVIKNLGLVDAYIYSLSGDYVGGICGYMNSQNSTTKTESEDSGIPLIMNCFVEGDVRGASYVGGIVGYMGHCHLRNCYQIGTVKRKNSNSIRIGGIAGDAHTKTTLIYNCYHIGTVASGYMIAGYVDVSLMLESCYYPNDEGDESILFCNKNDCIDDDVLDNAVQLESSFSDGTVRDLLNDYIDTYTEENGDLYEWSSWEVIDGITTLSGFDRSVPGSSEDEEDDIEETTTTTEETTTTTEETTTTTEGTTTEETTTSDTESTTTETTTATTAGVTSDTTTEETTTTVEETTTTSEEATTEETTTSDTESTTAETTTATTAGVTSDTTAEETTTLEETTTEEATTSDTESTTAETTTATTAGVTSDTTTEETTTTVGETTTALEETTTEEATTSDTESTTAETTTATTAGVTSDTTTEETTTTVEETTTTLEETTTEEATTSDTESTTAETTTAITAGVTSNTIMETTVTDVTSISEEEETQTTTTETGEALMLGDVDFDGDIDIIDATMTLQESVTLASGLESGFTAKQSAVADVDLDGEVTIADAYAILQYYTYAASAAQTIIWSETTVLIE